MRRCSRRLKDVGDFIMKQGSPCSNAPMLLSGHRCFSRNALSVSFQSLANGTPSVSSGGWFRWVHQKQVGFDEQL